VNHLRDDHHASQRLHATPRWRTAAGIGTIVGVALIALSCGGGLGNNADLPTTQRGRLTLILEDLAYAVAVPQYQAMTASFVDLQSATDAFCAAPDAAGLERTRAAWRHGMETWLTASTVSLGPIGDENRDLRIEFWPDANNNVSRAVDQMLLRDDVLTADVLARQSVAAQGLPALELLLFDPETDALTAFTNGDRAARRCVYARAITGNLVTIAQQVEAGWTGDGGYAVQLASSGRGSDVFATREAAIDEVVNQLVATLGVVRGNRIADPLGGGTAAEAKPFRAESVPSGNSLANISAVLRGVASTLGAGPRFGFVHYLRDSSRDALAAQLTGAIDTAQSLVAAIPVPLADAVQDDAQRPRVVELLDQTAALAKLVEIDLSAAMDVTIGFNENDGD
jgi:predicted lipoprotein